MMLGQKVLNGGRLSGDEALSLTDVSGSDTILLVAYANKVREKFTGNQVDLCSIINARSGNCTEDCAFCVQSAHHGSPGPVFDLIDEEVILSRAREMKDAGAHRFDIVTSGLGAHEDDPGFRAILRAVCRIREETGLKMCACLGTLTPRAAELLAEAGVTRYNHNLETAESFFPSVVTTHTYADRVETVRRAKAARMEVCCGGILGLGESPAQRVELAFALRDLAVDAVPLNILNPRPGTPLGGRSLMPPMEILKYIAIFRLILPDKNLRAAGGREVNLRDLQALALLAGLNGMLVGNYLTTAGRDPGTDNQMVTDLGFRVTGDA